MKEQIVARAYAQSIIELGEQDKVDVAKELTELNIIINENNDLETILFLDVFTIEEKQAVINDIFNKLKLSKIIVNFVNFLMQEKRIHIFPLIFKEVIVIDDHKRGFLRGVIEGRTDDVSVEFKEKIIKYIEERIGAKAQLDYKKNEEISAGYRITVEDLQLDASLENQLSNFKETILSE